MKYMLLIHHDEQAWEAVSESERQKVMEDSLAIARELHAAGKYLGANPLHPTSTATSVQVRDGRRLVTDGPFAETREQLAGYFLLDVKDADEAAAIAARIPAAQWGSVEIRPVMEIAGLPED